MKDKKKHSKSSGPVLPVGTRLGLGNLDEDFDGTGRWPDGKERLK